MRLTLGTSPPSSTSSSSRIYLLRCAFPRAPGGDRSRRLNRHTPSITVSLVSLSLPPFYRRHVRQCGAENNHHRHRRNVFNSNSASRKKREERWSQARGWQRLASTVQHIFVGGRGREGEAPHQLHSVRGHLASDGARRVSALLF